MDQDVSSIHQEQEPSVDQKPITKRASGRRQLGWRSVLLIAGAVVMLAGAGFYGRYYWTIGRFLVSTDDAYVQADNVIISPKVSGYISDVLVQDNEAVKSGQVLAQIDDRDYRTALAVALANVEAQQAGIENLIQQMAQQQLMTAEARATVTGDQAALAFSNQDNERYAILSKNGAGTVQNAQKSSSDSYGKQASLEHDTAAVGAAEKQIDVLGTQVVQARAILVQLQASMHQAELNVSYTTITSPVGGTVGARTLRTGQYVQAGTQLMAVVPLTAVYVIANYKETQLADVHAGQTVAIVVDTFSSATVHGRVNSIAPASGQEFALLPPDNATGNFTKIVQRVPVRIVIDSSDPLVGRLRPGMSVEPTIDTRARGK